MGLNSADPLIHRIFSVNTVKIYFLFLRLSFLFYFKDFIYFFLERGEGKEKERERNINVWLPLIYAPYGDLACNSGLCPDWESNR